MDAQWAGSKTQFVEIDRNKIGLPCRLGTPRLLEQEVQPDWQVFEGKGAGHLVKKGEQAARVSGRAVVLKLRTGERGKPATRIMLPPKGCMPSKVGEMKPRSPWLDQTQRLRDNERKMHPKTPHEEPATASPIERAQAVSSNVEEEMRALQEQRKADRRYFEKEINRLAEQKQVDLKTLREQYERDVQRIDEDNKRLSQMVESMRRDWRKNQGLPGQHPDLPNV